MLRADFVGLFVTRHARLSMRLRVHSRKRMLVGWLLRRSDGQQLPDVVFRPQCLSLITSAVQQLGIAVEPTRRTFALNSGCRTIATLPQHGQLHWRSL